MESEGKNVKLENHTSEPDAANVQQSRNILEEISILNQEAKDPRSQAFKKTTYWHQQPSAADTLNHDTLLKDLTGILTRMDAVLTKIEILLSKDS